MLDLFRKGGIVQVLMGGIVLLLVAAFAFDSRSGSAAGPGSQCAATVRGECVASRDFNAAMRLSVRQGITQKQIRALGLRQMVMDGLVERELLLKEAERLGISVSEEEVDSELRLGRVHYSMPAKRDGQWPMSTYVMVNDPKTEKFNFEIYKRSIRNNARMSTKDFKHHQKRELIASRMRDVIKSGVRLSEEEAFSQFVHNREKATARVAQLTSDWFKRFVAVVDENAVAEYAKKNSDSVDAAWKSAEKRYTEGCSVLQELVLRLPPAADKADEEKLKALGTSLRKRLSRASAAEFEVMARLYSSSPSGAHGGWKGCLDVTLDRDKVLLEATAKLAPGQLTELLEMPNGYRLLRVDTKLDKKDLEARGRQLESHALAVVEAGNTAMQAFADSLITATQNGAAPLQASLDAGVDAALTGPVANLTRSLKEEWLTVAKDARTRPRIEISSGFTRVDNINPIPDANQGIHPKKIAFALAQINAVYASPIPTRVGLAVLQLKDKSVISKENYTNEKSDFLPQLKAQAQSAALQRYLSNLRASAGADVVPNPLFLAEVPQPANKS